MQYKKILRISVTVVLIIIIFWQIDDLSQIIIILKRADLFLLCVTLFVITLDRAMMSYKWGYLLKSHGQTLPFFRGLKIYCASQIWGIALPSTVGADAIRAYLTSLIKLDTKTVITSIIVERMVGFIASLLLGLAAIGILSYLVEVNNHFRYILWITALLLLTSIILFAVSFSRNLYSLIYDHWLNKYKNSLIISKIARLHNNYLSFSLKKFQLFTFFGLTFIEQFFSFIIAWLIAQSLGINVGLIFMAGVIPLALLLSRLPISIDGIGVFEAVFIFAMSLAGISAAEAVTIAFSARFLQIIAWSPWWIAHMLENRQYSMQLPQKE